MPGSPTTEGLRSRRAAIIADPDRHGRAVTRALAAVTDAWLDALFTGVAGGDADVALLAVGGYGRGELAPGSDLDLLLVHRNRADIAAIAEAVWYPIWDQSVSLDHSVRTHREVGAAMDADLRVALGLLDVRTVAGSRALGAEIRSNVLDKWAARARRWLPEVGDAVAARHDRAGDLAFLLEPDIKDARGGLRDIHLLRALAQVTPVLADLVAEGRIDGPDDALTEARVELHRVTGRGTDRLALQDQDAVATAVGLGADALMARVADAGRTVSWASDDAWRRIRTLPSAGLFRRRSWAPRPLEPGLAMRNDEVTLLPDADPAVDPTLALRAAAASAERGLPLARVAIDRFRDSAPAPPGVWPADLLQALLRLLGAGRPAIAAIETLDQQGVIERLLPEWGPVRSRPQRNAYHRFTVDRHLLETVANATALVRRVDRPDLLLLGALLHDIGKGSPGDHTDAGVEIVSSVGARIGLPPADVDVLASMVRHHLLLPEVATRRDLDDPGTIGAVADAVGDRRTLGLLAALTESDSLATGPAAWGGWKAGLVGRLVDLVGRRLDGDAHPAPPEPTDAQQRLLDAGGLAVVSQGSALTVVAPDRPGLLATVAGVLALDGASVRSATTLVGRSATSVALVLHVTPTWDVLPTAARIEADLLAVAAGELDLAGRLAAEAGTAPWRRRTATKRAVGPEEPTVVVAVDGVASQVATVVEVRAPDARGTLWRIASALGDVGLTITSAVASTLGAEVVDTFYVKAGGAKLDPATQDRVVEAVTAAVLGR